jgi:large subunit ribosomal protein L21
MYAVIRTGGKQYRVAPGDVIRVEKAPVEDNRVEFSDVLAISASDGQIARPGEGRVIGQVVEQGRADKVLVFHYKRKKQYKKLRGHRQPFTAVRITEIAFDGQSFSAAELPAKPEKKVKPARPPAEAETPEAEVEAAPRKAAAAHKKSAPKKAAAKKAAPKKKPKK